MKDIYLLVKASSYRDGDNRPVIDEQPDTDAGFFTDRTEAERVAAARNEHLHEKHEEENRSRRTKLGAARSRWAHALKEDQAIRDAGLQVRGRKRTEPMEPQQISFEDYLEQVKSKGTLVVFEVVRVGAYAAA